MTAPSQTAEDMVTRPPVRFVDLHDDILREIADCLDVRRDTQLISPPTHESPRPIDSRYVHRPAPQAEHPQTLNQCGKDRRALRAVCRRTARVIAPNIHLKIKTIADLRSWATASGTAAAAIT